MKTPVYLTLRVGDVVLTIEHSSGDHVRPDTVTLAVREARAGRRAGARLGVAFGQQRADLLDFAIGILELVDRMPARREPDTMPPLLTRTPEKRALRRRMADSNAVDPMADARAAVKRYENLRARALTLYLAQRVLERADEETVGALHVLLACALESGKLPVSMTVQCEEVS
uniref:hypothetical protein n=1 Tax=Burkholderia arboris TaxID=488730 RepID=UPI003BEEF89D